MNFKVGDVVRHKATRKRCVIREIDPDGSIIVTTQDDETRSYKPEELEIYQVTQVGGVSHLY